MDSILTTENVTKRFGRTVALDEVSFQIPGGLSMLLGPNGSGKTTFLRIACGLLVPDEGEVKIFGHDPYHEYGEIIDRVSFALQKPHLPQNITVRDFLEGVKTEKNTRSYTGAVKAFGLEDMLDKKFKHLSGGFKKRVSLAQAFIGKPDLIIVDEPFANLDIEAKLRISDMINDLSEKEDTSLVVITHDLGSLEPDHLTILYAGKTILSDHYRDLGFDDIRSFILEKESEKITVTDKKELRKHIKDGAEIIDVEKRNFENYLKEKFEEGEINKGSSIR